MNVREWIDYLKLCFVNHVVSPLALALPGVPGCRHLSAFFAAWAIHTGIVLVLRHGSVRHINDMTDALDTSTNTFGAALSDLIKSEIPDRERFVLERDSDAWRSEP